MDFFSLLCLSGFIFRPVNEKEKGKEKIVFNSFQIQNFNLAQQHLHIKFMVDQHGSRPQPVERLVTANCEITFQPLEKKKEKIRKEMHTCTERQQFLYDERNRLEDANPRDSISRPLLPKRGVAARRPVTSFQSTVNQRDVESRGATWMISCFPPTLGPLFHLLFITSKMQTMS